MSAISEVAVDRFVQLGSGLVLPIEPVLIAHDLEARGFRMAAYGEGGLLVSPLSKLTIADCAQIRRWKWHLLAIVTHEAAEV
jgi:hypothetical protein